MRTPLRIFIGYDPKESAAFHVLTHSILRRASEPVAIIPLVRSSLTRFTRARGPLETTEFSMTRFLVPSLCDFEGVAVFMDCDMLCLTDINDLWLYPLADPGRAVYVCQHDYTPHTGQKMGGQTQTAYPRKNWSSLMLFDCTRCTALTPDYVNTASGLDLHRFNWLTDSQIGKLPLEWNWLVGEYAMKPFVKVLHYTLGGPWFEATSDCDHACSWLDERNAMLGGY